MFNIQNFRRAVMALVLAACSSLAAAAGTLTVELDTSGFGSNGWIDISLAHQPMGVVATHADLGNFVNFGSSDGAELYNTSGSLLDGFRIQNVYGEYNDLFHAVNFGGKVSFTVSFSGDADPSGAFGSTLSVTLFGADKVTLLGDSSSADGSLLHLNWTPSATVGGQGSVAGEVLGSGVSISPVPEAETWAMMLGGLALLGLVRRRQYRG
nr:NF038129 family PEP-CTERM protein [uncultured Duganella sp.]